MKNLTLQSNPGAKYETRYQSGFQRIGGIYLVSFWEAVPKERIHHGFRHLY